MANPYFPPRSNRGDGYSPNPLLRPTISTAASPTSSAPPTSSRISWHDSSPRERGGEGGGGISPISNMGGSPFDQASIAGSSKSAGAAGMGAQDPRRMSGTFGQRARPGPAQNPTDYGNASRAAGLQNSSYPSAQQQANQYRDPYAYSQASPQQQPPWNGPSRVPAQQRPPSVNSASNIYRLSYSGRPPPGEAVQQAAVYPPYAANNGYPPPSSISLAPSTSSHSHTFHASKNPSPLQTDDNGSGIPLPILMNDSEYNDGVYHPSTGRKLDRSKLTEEQRKIADEFPEDLDEEGGSLWHSMIAVAKDWRKYTKWRYLHWYILFIVVIVVVALMTIYHKQIVNWLTPVSKEIRSVPAGWLIPIAILFVISFPPLFGHEIIAVLCGVIYGLWIGFAIVSAGTMLGEIGNFYAFKGLLRKRASAYEKKNLDYACMAHIVREGGFFVVLLARLSAIPGHFTTAVFATVGMNIFVFVLACLLSMPKQLSIVYLGVIIEQSGNATKEPLKSRIISYVVLFISIVITLGAGWYLYGKMFEARPVVRARLRDRRYRMLSEARRTDNFSSAGPGGLARGDSLAAAPMQGKDLYQNGGIDDFEDAKQQGQRQASGGSGGGWPSRWLPGAAAGNNGDSRRAQGDEDEAAQRERRGMLAAAAPLGKYADSSSSRSHSHEDLHQNSPIKENGFSSYPSQDSYENFGRRELHEFGPSIAAPSLHTYEQDEDPDRTLGVQAGREVQAQEKMPDDKEGLYQHVPAIGSIYDIAGHAQPGEPNHPLYPNPHAVQADALTDTSSPPSYAGLSAHGHGLGNQASSEGGGSRWMSAHEDPEAAYRPTEAHGYAR